MLVKHLLLVSFDFYKILTSDAGFGPLNLYVSGADIPAITDVDGDLVGVSQKWIIVAPSGIRVSREKLRI